MVDDPDSSLKRCPHLLYNFGAATWLFFDAYRVDSVFRRCHFSPAVASKRDPEHRFYCLRRMVSMFTGTSLNSRLGLLSEPSRFVTVSGLCIKRTNKAPSCSDLVEHLRAVADECVFCSRALLVQWYAAYMTLPWSSCAHLQPSSRRRKEKKRTNRDKAYGKIKFIPKYLRVCSWRTL